MRQQHVDAGTRLLALPARGPRTQRLRAVIEAFTEPMRQRAGDPGWDNYFRFIAQLANSGHDIRRFVAADFIVTCRPCSRPPGKKPSTTPTYTWWPPG